MFITFEPILGVVLGADYFEFEDSKLIAVSLLVVRILFEW